MPNEYEPTMPAETPAIPTPEPEEDEGEASALLPKSILGGKAVAVGDELALTVVAIHEDEIEVSYDSEGAGPKEPESEMAKAEASLEDLGK